MLSVKIEGLDDLTRKLGSMSRQVPFAAARAITQTAKSVESKLQSSMAGAFKSPSPYVKRSTFATVATKVNLSSTVGIKDQKPSGGTAPAVLLKEHFTGGVRGNKPFEKALIAMGVMPGGYRAIPGRGMRLNAYGNPSRDAIRRILEVIQKGDIYDGAVNTGQSRFRQKNNADISYFVKKVGDTSWRSKHLDPGIYRRVNAGRGKNSAAIPVLIFVKQASYHKVLDFMRDAQQVIATDFQQNFDKFLADAIRTAR